MARIQIPERFRESFLLLARLNAKQFASFKKTILKERKSLDTGEIVRAVSDSIDTINIEEANKLVSLIYSLYSLKDEANSSVGEDFLEVIVQALKDDKNIEIKEKETEKVGERISQLVNGDSPLKFIYDANNDYVSHERILRDSSIATDLRPFFSVIDEELTDFKGGIVTHTLKLMVHQEEKNIQEIYVALDIDDMRKLSDQIQKAIQKETLINEYLSESSLYYIDSGSKDS